MTKVGVTQKPLPYQWFWGKKQDETQPAFTAMDLIQLSKTCPLPGLAAEQLSTRLHQHTGPQGVLDPVWAPRKTGSARETHLAHTVPITLISSLHCTPESQSIKKCSILMGPYPILLFCSSLTPCILSPPHDPLLSPGVSQPPNDHILFSPQVWDPPTT